MGKEYILAKANDLVAEMIRFNVQAKICREQMPLRKNTSKTIMQFVKSCTA